MRVLKLKRKEIMFLLMGLGQITGIRDSKKALDLAHDRRKLRELQEETEEALAMCQTDRYKELLEELQELKRKKAREIGDKEGALISEAEITSHVMLLWEHSKEFQDLDKEYARKLKETSREVVEVELKTEKLTFADFEKKAIPMELAEVMSYFE